MRLKTTHKAIHIVAAVISAVLLFGCEKVPLPNGGETTDLTLNIGVQSASPSLTKADGEGGTAEAYEGIRTLRVIIVSKADAQGARRILYNVKDTVDGSEAPVTAVLSTSVTMKKVPVGLADIYVIANEESIMEEGMGYTDEVLLGDEYKEDDKLLVLNKEVEHFPKTYDDIARFGLPMSGKQENVEILPGNTGTIGPISLTRAVVKLNLTVENKTAGNITLDSLKSGEFVSDRVFMYRKDDVPLDIPEGTQYRSLEIGTDVDLAEGEKTNWQPVYIYPNNVSSNQYTLELTTTNKTYGPAPLNDVHHMIRNTQFNITIRITASATIGIDYEQVDWTKKEITVPPFK